MNDLTLNNVSMTFALTSKRVLCIYIMARSNYSFSSYNNTNLTVPFTENRISVLPFPWVSFPTLFLERKAHATVIWVTLCVIYFLS
jgi:hypothetical protein